MRLNHRQIEAFRAVYVSGSMTLAGDMMGITQPAVSRLIRDLEAEVGIPLFDRKGGRVLATSDAAVLYREVQRSFHGLDRVSRTASELAKRRVGDLRIAAAVAVSFYYLPPVIQQFRTDWQDVDIALHACTAPEVVDLVAIQQYDLGIATTTAEASGVQTLPLPVMNIVCVLPDGHPLAACQVIRPEDLADEPLLMISDYSRVSQQIYQAFEAAGVTPNVVFESTFSTPICDLVARGDGVSLTEPLTAFALAGKGLVLRPFEPEVQYKLNVIFPNARPLTDRAEAFVEILRGHLQAVVTELP